ncbi:hypothetical protein [Clavibacter michiganensis]|nr:hypothetical protein [Clavibacter michiganensis]
MTAATAHRGDSSRHRENTLAAIRSAAATSGSRSSPTRSSSWRAPTWSW